MGSSIFEAISAMQQYHLRQVFKNKPSKIFKGCLPEILLCPFLNTLSHLFPTHLNTKTVGLIQFFGNSLGERFIYYVILVILLHIDFMA